MKWQTLCSSPGESWSILHHDAITGTSKEYVVQDFENKLYYAYNASQKVVSSLTQFLLTKGKLTSPMVFQPQVVRPNAKSISIQTTVTANSDGTQVVLFNPLGKVRVEMMTLYVDTDNIALTNSQMEEIPFQLNPVWESATSIRNDKFEIVFPVELQPLALSSFYLHRTGSENKFMHPSRVTIYNSLEFASPPDLKFTFERPRHSGNFKDDIVIESEILSAAFSSRSGMMKHIDDKVSGNRTYAEVKFMKYKSQGSGAYLFYPNGEATPLLNSMPIIHVVEGPLVSKIEVLYQNIQHCVTLYNIQSEQGRGLHIHNRIDMHANQLQNLKDMEIIMRVNSDVKNDNMEFYTDQNGFQLTKRRNNPKVYLEANYYPITTMLVMEDTQRRITLHSGQSHGVASLSRGQFEVMLDRELIRDDERGLSEGVRDNKLTDTFFVLQVEYRDTDSPVGASHDITFPSLLSHQISDFLQHPVISVFTTISTDISRRDFHPVHTPLPCDHTIVSFKNLVNSDLQYSNSSIIFHRRGYTCGFPTSGIQCSLYQNLSFSSFFKNIFHDIRKTTLTHMHELQNLTPKSELSIQPMDLSAYVISV